MDAPKNIPEVPKKEIKERLINEGFKDSEPSAFVRMSVLARNDVEVLIKSKEVCIGLPIKPPKKPAWELRPSEIGNFSGFKRILKDHFEKQPDPPYQRGNFKENNRGYLVGQVEIDETDDFESIFQKIMALVEEGEKLVREAKSSPDKGIYSPASWGYLPAAFLGGAAVYGGMELLAGVAPMMESSNTPVVLGVGAIIGVIAQAVHGVLKNRK